MSKSLVTIDEALARMINFGYIHPGCTPLEMTQFLKQAARENRENTKDDDQMEAHFQACKSMVLLTQSLSSHLDWEINNRENSLLKIYPASSNTVKLDVESVAQWARHHYNIVRFDYEELDYNTIIDGSEKHIDKEIKKITGAGLTPELAIRLYQTFTYLLELLAERDVHKFGTPASDDKIAEHLYQRASASERICDNQKIEAIKGRIELAKAISAMPESTPYDGVKSQRMKKSSITIDEAVARMINLGYIQPGYTLLDMTESLVANAENDDANKDGLPDNILEARFKAHEARHYLASYLHRHLTSELENPPKNSLLIKSHDSTVIPKLDVESVAQWARHHYAIARFDYEELNYNAFIDDPMESIDKKVKAIINDGLTPKLAIRLYLTIAYLLEAFAEKAGNTFGTPDNLNISEIAGELYTRALTENGETRKNHDESTINDRIKLAKPIKAHLNKEVK